MTTYAQEVEYYELKVDELRRGQLAAVQSTARRWSTLMATLLGVYGTVAFAGGLTTVDRLPIPFGTATRVVITLAAASAITAIALLARASGGLKLSDLPNLNGKMLMAREVELTEKAQRQFSQGRRFALLTVGLVLAGSTAVLWTPEKPSDLEILARFPDATACGSTTIDHQRVKVANRDASQALELIPVGACPQ